jgi:hypothetical protein
MEQKNLNFPRISNTINKWANELNRHFSKKEVQMANKYMKKCSASLAIKEMQIKTTLRFYLTPVRMAIIKNTNNNKCLQGCRGNSIYNWWEGKLVQPLWKSILHIEVLEDTKNITTIWSNIPLLGIYLKECKSVYNRETCTSMCIAALFTIAKLWKYPRCPTTDEWIM